MDKHRAERAERQASKDFKLRRQLLKGTRSKRSTVQEDREGITYSTDCGLDGICNLFDVSSGKSITL